MQDFIRRTPAGEDRERRICDTCGFVDYENPRVVVGSVVSHDGRILLCRRAIEPRQGYWTLPAGYLELGETVEDGARREAWEEARAHIALDGVLALYSISRIGQVQVIFRGGFEAGPHYQAGPESLDVRLFDWAEIPWDEIAFPSVHWSLQAWLNARGRPLGAPAGNPAEDPKGMRPLRIETSEGERQ